MIEGQNKLTADPSEQSTLCLWYHETYINTQSEELHVQQYFCQKIMGFCEKILGFMLYKNYFCILTCSTFMQLTLSSEVDNYCKKGMKALG